MPATTTTVASSASPYATSAFWERLWRTSGLQFIAFAVIAYLVYGYQPPVGASTDSLVAFYDGHRARILIAAVLSGMAILNLLWFAAALRSALAEAGQDGWGAAATAASATVGETLLLLITVGAALAYSIARSGNNVVASTLNDFSWACAVLSSFPRAMLIMAGTLGFWRAGLISTGVFAAGVAAIVLVLLGGTTWLSSGFWAPDGAYSRFVSPIIGLVWVLGASRILLTQSPGARAGW